VTALRIVIASQFALPHVGGIETMIDAVATTLVRHGHDVTHVVTSCDQPPCDNGNRAYRLVTIPAINPFERLIGVPYAIFAPHLRSTMRRLLADADVFHGHGFLSQNATVGLRFARRRPHMARVLTEHVGHVPYTNVVIDRIENVAIRTIGRHTASLAQALVTYNTTVEQQLRRLVPEVPVVHIENGVDAGHYRPPATGERERLRAELGWDAKPRVIFVGRLVEKKGIDVAIAAARAAGDLFQLVVVGPGKRPADHPNVLALGTQPPERVAELYRASDAFLLPSRGEGFPLACQEAMASGLPVVLSDDAPYRTILAGAGRAASMVPASSGAVLDALRAILPVTREAGAEAREFAVRRFSWDRAAEEHVALYRRLMERRA
jgi:D-inositol-3-phosphate glycosyltransferase